MKKRFEIRIVAEENNHEARMVSFDMREQPTNDNCVKLGQAEATSINAIVMYRASVLKVPESIVESAMLAYFDVDSVKDMPSMIYDDVVRWLVNWRGGAEL